MFTQQVQTDIKAKVVLENKYLGSRAGSKRNARAATQTSRHLSRQHHLPSLQAVRSDKQADQADANTLQLIADITQ